MIDGGEAGGGTAISPSYSASVSTVEGSGAMSGLTPSSDAATRKSCLLRVDESVNLDGWDASLVGLGDLDRNAL